MTFALFYHSALSDWNHGNAHFLRGVATELQARGHSVVVYEPADAWSARHLVEDHGEAALWATLRAYPSLQVVRYTMPLQLDTLLDDADVVLVHEWNPPALVRQIGEHHARCGGYVLLFHDTHHRIVSDREAMAAYDLTAYDGVLAFGEVIRQRYIEHGWSTRAWTWHEAADVRVFAPMPDVAPARDLVWIGNWGDGEREEELREFLIDPIRDLGLSATLHGVRYPEPVLAVLADAGIAFEGWLPNFEAPRAFARHRVTVHVPRRPYVEALPGIPTIRPFEALACGIPLISAPWHDDEGLFRAGVDYLVAANGAEMRQRLREVLADPARAAELSRHGLETIRGKHTCAHRAAELLAIVAAIDGGALNAGVDAPTSEVTA